MHIVHCLWYLFCHIISSMDASATVPVVNAAVAFEDICTNNTIILLIYKARYVEDMENNLVPPFMMCLAQIQLNEEPKFLATNPTLEHHSMYCPERKCKYISASKA